MASSAKTNQKKVWIFCTSTIWNDFSFSQLFLLESKVLEFVDLMRERKSRRSATTLTCSSSFANMVPQQTSNGSRADSPTNTNGQPMFGSLLVDRKSSTPYSDATQVGIFLIWPPRYGCVFFSLVKFNNMVCHTVGFLWSAATWLTCERREAKITSSQIIPIQSLFFSCVVFSYLRVCVCVLCVCVSVKPKFVLSRFNSKF